MSTAPKHIADDTRIDPALEPAEATPSPRPGIPDAPPADASDLTRLLYAVWRAATDRDTPTLLQLTSSGRVRRVDVDAVSGYIAVVTDDDTHRALGVRREWVAPLVAALTGRERDAVAAELEKGPARLPHRDAASETGPATSRSAH